MSSNMDEKRHKIFKKKDEIDESPDDSTDVFHRNMLERYSYIDCPNKHFKNDRYCQL